MPRKFNVHGNIYEVDDALQGPEFDTAISELEAHSRQKNVSRFLTALSKSEGAGYDTIVGGKQKITDYSRHPQIVGLRTAEGPSTAAGRYQITGTTFKEFAGKAGVTDFSPESQDKVALKIIEQEGALDMIQTGDFRGAVGKLGGRWASLPSSKYSQPKWTMEAFEAALGVKPGAAPVAPAAAAPGAPVPYGAAPKKVDPATFNKNADWLRASRQVFSLNKRKGFEGNDDEAAEYGKEVMGYFNSNLPVMAVYAKAVIADGTKEDKEAFMYLLETYDNTTYTMEGAGRFLKGMATDITNVVGIATLGVGSVGKVMATAAAKQGIKKALLESLGRTGIIAGVEGAVLGAAENTIRQNVMVAGGRQKEVSLGGVAAAAGLGAVAGVVGGTALDAAGTAGVNTVRRWLDGRKAAAAPKARIDPTLNPAVQAPAAPVAATTGTPSGNPSQQATAALLDDLMGPAPQMVGPPRPDPALAPVTLTPDEIAEATARQQQGRHWTDNLPAVEPARLADESVYIPTDGMGGARSTPILWKDVIRMGGDVADQLRAMPDKDLHANVEWLRHNTNVDEAPAVFKALQILKNEMVLDRLVTSKQLQGATADQALTITAKLDAIDARSIPVRLADDAFGSLSGSLLNQRKAGIPIPQDFNIESLMNQGLTREAAEAEWARVVDGLRVTKEADDLIKVWDDQINAALKAGDYDEAGALTVMKNRELDAAIEVEMRGGGGFWAAATEISIANVFSPTTVAINLVPATAKTFMVPLMKALVNDPLKLATRVELSANLTAMRQTVGGAWRAARAAFRYEQAMLTRDVNRSTEMGNLIIKGQKGGLLRTIPRILAASDEFLGQLNYASFVSGKAAAQAVQSGTEQSLTGAALNTHIKEAITAAMKGAYEQPSGESLIQPILVKGMNLGFKGDALREYAEREITRGGLEKLRGGSNEAALDLTRDVLYKRTFSGKGTTSGLTRKAEAFVNEHPGIRLVSGQLFLRTPIRVFEEGIRLTPGLQLIAPNFMKDLAGSNGSDRQIRAQAEAMMSVAIVGAVLTMYTTGSIRGDGAYDNWKAGRTDNDGGEAGTYTLKMQDGSTWSYRSFDPIAVPFKIITNGLERLDRLMIRQAQGEEISPETLDGAVAYVSVGTTAIGAALRDANLAAGVDGMIKLYEGLTDPEGKEDAWLKFFGEKLGYLVPNTFTKIAKTNDPAIKDPASFWQVVESKLAGVGADRLDNEIKTSKSYDVFGNARMIADTGALWNIASTASIQERAKALSPEALLAHAELRRLQQQTGAVFTVMGPKNKSVTGELDLRTVMTSDGKETLFDRWATKFQALSPESAVLPLLQSALSEGTFKFKGDKTAEVQSQLKDLSDLAFSQLMAEESQLIDAMQKQIADKAMAKTGQRDWLLRDK